MSSRSLLSSPIRCNSLWQEGQVVVDFDDNLDPPQMGRQRATVDTSLLGPRGSVGRSRLIRCRLIACCCLLDVFEAEQHLIFGQRLGPAAKTVPLQFLDDLTQPLALTPLGEQHRFHVSRSSGNTSLAMTESDHIRQHLATSR
jgi:hypothetical protein